MKSACQRGADRFHNLAAEAHLQHIIPDFICLRRCRRQSRRVQHSYYTEANPGSVFLNCQMEKAEINRSPTIRMRHVDETRATEREKQNGDKPK